MVKRWALERSLWLKPGLVGLLLFSQGFRTWVVQGPTPTVSTWYQGGTESEFVSVARKVNCRQAQVIMWEQQFHSKASGMLWRRQVLQLSHFGDGSRGAECNPYRCIADGFSPPLLFPHAQRSPQSIPEMPAPTENHAGVTTRRKRQEHGHAKIRAVSFVLNLEIRANNAWHPSAQVQSESHRSQSLPRT